MTVSADTLRLGIVREATPGVTPANPAFQLLRLTSESLAFAAETQLSNELNPARQLADVIVSGGQSGGDVSYEVSSNPGFELLLTGVLANNWAGQVLTVGSLMFTHTIEKRFAIDPTNADPTKQYEYDRITRAIIDSMALTFSPGGPATGTSTIIGGPYTIDSALLTGASYLPTGALPVMTGAGVLPITFTLPDASTSVGWCVSNLVVTFRNNGRAITCLGDTAAREVVLGRFECEITADVYINVQTDEMMRAFLNGQEIALTFTVNDQQNNSYKFTFPRVRIATATQQAGGTNQDVIMSLSMQALVKDITTPVTASTCVIIERVHTSSPWPTIAESELRALGLTQEQASAARDAQAVREAEEMPA